MQSKNYPKSDSEKRTFIEEFFEGKAPHYLWYNVGSKRSVVNAPILAQTKTNGGFGNVELHEVYSDYYVGVPETRKRKPWWTFIAGIVKKSDMGLRVRGAEFVQPSICLDDKLYPLYAAANGNGERGVNFATGKAYGPKHLKDAVIGLGFEYEIR